ncbi:MAG: pyruvate kinase [Thermoplasmatota archaeon]
MDAGDIRKTKIIGSVGPSCGDPETIGSMVDSGMDVVRLNFSHSDGDWHKRTFNMLRDVSRDIAILCDIQGPKIRCGRMSSPFRINPGDTVGITSRDVPGTKEMFTVSYPHLEEDLVAGDEIFINDGLVKLRVIENLGDHLACIAERGGMVSDRKGCNIPSGNLTISTPTEKDIRDLEVISGLDPEFVAVSFVNTPEDTKEVRDALNGFGNDRIKLISKIERPRALQNLDGIIKASEGVMVARGDLGVEIPPYEVPAVQKDVIKRCNREGKMAVVATQMLDSMVNNTIPTRAEANDVFNAVLDGADALMLSNETSVGKYPVESVKTMSEILRRAEKMMPGRDPEYYDSESPTMIEAMGHGCYTLASQFEQMGYSGRILAITDTGYSARMISKYRPDLTIIGLTSNERTARELRMIWGVLPLHSEGISGSDIEEKVHSGLIRSISEGLLSDGDHAIVVLSSLRTGDNGFYSAIYDLSEFMRLHL